MKQFFTACLITILFLCFSGKAQAFTYPNGGEVLKGGSGHKIKFHAEGIYYFWYSIDSGATWNYIGQQNFYSRWNESSYFWVTPAVTAKNCFLRMADEDNISNFYNSARFSIQYNGSTSLNLSSFNDGEKVDAGSSKEITWQSTGVSSFVSLSYSSDAGITWETIAAKVPNNGKYLWNIPTNPSVSAVIKITDYKNKYIVSQSKKAFLIKARPLIFVTTPKAADALEAGTSYAVNWKAYNLSTDFVDIEFSSDSGKSWQALALNEANDGSYSWNVPNKNIKSGFIRIKDRKISSAFQLSGIFSISSRSLTLDYPDYGVSLTGCTTQKITWTSTGKTNTRVNLYLTSDNGNTWSLIASNVNTVFGRNNYSWTPPGIRSGQCKIKVVDMNSSEFTDESDASFSINYDNSKTLTIISPNGGESIKSGNTQVITWSQNGLNNSSVKLKFSADKGSTWSDITTYATNGSYSWTVPEITSSKFLVRVEDYYTSCIYDQSDAPFTVTAPGSMYVYSLGDTLFHGTQKTITWYGRNLKSDYVNIEFSSNGTSWSSISTKEINDGSYNWNIPTIVSNNCYLRVTDFADPAITNTGPKFSIKQAPVVTPSIKLIYPDSYVSVYAYRNQTDTIKWTSKDLASAYVNIEFSKDDAKTWESVATHVPNNGKYAWYVPYIETTQAFIRISEYGNPSVRDSSDYYFRIEKPSLKLISPNGGEVLSSCGKTYINYNSKGGGAKKCFLSKDNGLTWEPIDGGTYGTEWNTQYVNCTQCKIRIVDQKDPSVEDISDAPFTVTCTEKRQRLQLTSPVGGEVLTNNNVHKVTWSSTKDLRYGSVDLYMSLDGGLNWQWAYYYDGAAYSGDIDDYGTYDWRPQIVADKVILRIQEWQTIENIYDQSKAYFSVKGKPSINVLSPSESDKIMAGTSKTIKWETDYIDTNLVSLAYSKNGGTSWTIIAANEVNDGEYLWTVPEDTSSSYVIKVYDAKTTTTFGTKSFKVQKPLNIVAPAGGEVIDKCSNFSIKWKSTYAGYTDLLYSLNNGATWNNLSTYVTTRIGDNSYTTIFSNLSENLIIKARNTYDTSQYDLSLPIKIGENPYASLKLLYPNGLQELKGGVQDTIRWETKGDIPYVNIQYSTNSGVTWNSLDYGNIQNKGKYKWDVPNSNYSNVLVRVAYSQNTCIYDQNDTIVSIKGRPRITIYSPNGGNTVYTGSVNTISWSNENSYGGLIKIEYSSDSGSTWKVIDDNVVNMGDYYWKVNSAPSNKYLIRVTDKSDINSSDVSNQVFTVKGPNITISAPATSDTLFGCDVSTISWIAEGTSGTHEISYSTNNGSTWNTITDKATGPSYNWTVPTGISGTQCMIRVRDVSNPLLQATTGAVRIASEKLFVRLTSPSNAEILKSGYKKIITWQSSKHISNVHLYYSTDSGKSWNNILYYSNNTNSFEWTVPNVASNLCLLQLKDASSCATDSSASPFTIQKAPYFTIISPNIGTYISGTSNTIQWSSTNYTGTTVNIDWSKDAGKTWTNVGNQINNTGSYNWTLPAVSSDSFYVRVSDPSNPLAFDVNDYTIKIAKPYLRVKSPVAGDTLVGCQTALIYWDSFGGAGTYMIDFSSDNGKTWKNITNATYSTPYGWTVPTVQSNDCYIKISNPADTSFKAISAKFAIKYNTSYIKILTPNGGEAYDTGKDINITWESVNSSSKVKFDYSTNGTTWYPYDQIPNTGKYTWYYSVAAENLWVRISDLNYNCYSDASDKSFSVRSVPYLRITKPAKKDTIYAGQKYDLSWYSSFNSTTNAQIHYSANEGATWTLVASVSNTGFYSWTVPDLSSGSYLLKVTSEANLSSLDITNITIQKPVIEIVAPVENEVLYGCTTKKIEWKGKGLSAGVRLSYSADNGVTWNNIISSATNYGYYNWTVPGINSSQCLVKVTDLNSPNINIVSPKTFSIQSNKIFQFSYPSGGELVKPGSTMEIKWSYNALINNVDLAYSTNSGVSWITIGTFVNTGSYLWTVPSTVSASYMIRIVDNSATCRVQTSNIFSVATEESQSLVWPGDANNDGVANNYDLLALGLAYGSSGPLRATITNVWSGQQASDWNPIQSNGKNMKYADSNGDGVVNYSDTTAISQNYGFTHTVSAQSNTLALNPELYFVVPPVTASGEILYAELWAGSSSYPVKDLYGIAFKIGYDGSVAEGGSAKLEFNDSWIGVAGSNAMIVQKGIQNTAVIDGAIVRNNKTTVSGYGKIADIKVKLKKDGQISSGTLKVLEYKAISQSGSAVILDPKDQKFEVGVITGNKEAERLNCTIYPNPNAGQFYLQSTVAGEAQISITDLLGNTVYKIQCNLSGAKQELNPGLKAGMYLVKIECGEGRIIHPLIIE